MTNSIDISEISTLTDGQEILISMLSLFSGTLSILGSSLIIYLVRKEKKKTPYKRILLGLSVCDAIASITYAIQPFLLPAETSQRALAMGNAVSCDILGFMTQFSFSTIWYNGMLSYYYLLTVRYGVKTRRFQKRYEPAIHILCIGFNFLSAAVGLGIGLYNENELGQTCWIADYPTGCDLDDEIDCVGTPIGWVYGGLPTVFMFLSILINNIVIYRYVRETMARSLTKSLSATSAQQKRMQAVATQGFLYTFTFFISYTWAFVIKVLEGLGFSSSDESSLFVILVLQSFFLPLQGFFNLMVYSRPNYLQCRKEFPDEGRFWALRRSWFGHKIRRGTISAGMSRVNDSVSRRSGAASTNWGLIRSRASRSPMEREDLEPAESQLCDEERKEKNPRGKKVMFREDVANHGKEQPSPDTTNEKHCLGETHQLSGLADATYNSDDNDVDEETHKYVDEEDTSTPMADDMQLSEGSLCVDETLDEPHVVGEMLKPDIVGHGRQRLSVDDDEKQKNDAPKCIKEKQILHESSEKERHGLDI